MQPMGDQSSNRNASPPPSSSITALRLRAHNAQRSKGKPRTPHTTLRQHRRLYQVTHCLARKRQADLHIDPSDDESSGFPWHLAILRCNLRTSTPTLPTRLPLPTHHQISHALPRSKARQATEEIRTLRRERDRRNAIFDASGAEQQRLVRIKPSPHEAFAELHGWAGWGRVG